jgi:hypothetical protein
MQFVKSGLIPRGTDGEVDRDWLDEYDNARLQVRVTTKCQVLTITVPRSDC